MNAQNKMQTFIFSKKLQNFGEEKHTSLNKNFEMRKFMHILFYYQSKFVLEMEKVVIKTTIETSNLWTPFFRRNKFQSSLVKNINFNFFEEKQFVDCFGRVKKI